MPRERAFTLVELLIAAELASSSSSCRHDARFSLEHVITRQSADRRFSRCARGVADDGRDLTMLFAHSGTQILFRVRHQLPRRNQ